ncbi:MAG TPA: hypothetical protein VGK02_04695 [Candidatus Aquicultor sp.]|jgi:hypothetical protein
MFNKIIANIGDRSKPTPPTMIGGIMFLTSRIIGSVTSKIKFSIGRVTLFDGIVMNDSTTLIKMNIVSSWNTIFSIWINKAIPDASGT